MGRRRLYPPKPDCKVRDLAIVLLLADGQVTRDQLAGAEVKDFDAEAGTLAVYDGRKRRAVTLPPEAAEALRAWLWQWPVPDGPLVHCQDKWRGARHAMTPLQIRNVVRRLAYHGDARALAVIHHNAAGLPHRRALQVKPKERPGAEDLRYLKTLCWDLGEREGLEAARRLETLINVLLRTQVDGDMTGTGRGLHSAPAGRTTRQREEGGNDARSPICNVGGSEDQACNAGIMESVHRCV